MVTEAHVSTPLRGEKARILVVEDEPLVRELICTQLTRDGSAPRGASTGEEALALIDRERFDLILLDIRLPGMSGIEACRQIRARSDVPVVFVTAAASLQERLEGFDAGADDYVIKPVEILELNRRIRAILRRRGGWDETPDACRPCRRGDALARARSARRRPGARPDAEGVRRAAADARAPG